MRLELGCPGANRVAVIDLDLNFPTTGTWPTLLETGKNGTVVGFSFLAGLLDTGVILARPR